MTDVLVKFSLEELNQFANLSRDHNPLHVDARYARKTPFGQRVVFGALAVIKCLQHTRFANNLNLAELDVEFHNTLFIDTAYAVIINESSAEVGTIELREGSKTLLRLRYKRQENAHSAPLMADQESALRVLTEATDKTIDEFSTGDHFTGIYDLDHGATSDAFAQAYGQHFEPLIIMLTSYLVGMETPGTQALFSKLNLVFQQSISANSRIHYDISVDKAERSLGLLFLALDIRNRHGDCLAQGKIQTFVRSKLKRTDRNTMMSLLPPDAPQLLKNKTALIIGGSRGLGAELAQALVLAGAEVYLNYANSDEEAAALQAAYADLPNPIHLLKGSVADYDFCQDTFNQIFDASGSLDIVICNACASPKVVDLSSTSATVIQHYIERNLGLVANPLTVFNQALANSRGIFCTISSIYVETGSKDFPQYVALKNTVEALVKTSSLTNRQIRHLVVRPPKLLTDMSNTPIGSIGALNPALVAADIATQLSRMPDDHNHLVLNQFRNNEALAAVDKTQPATPSATHDQHEANGPEVCLAATCSIDLVIPSLRLWSNTLSLPFNFVTTPYNQPFQELLSPQSQFNQNSDGYNVLFLRFEDWLPYLSKETKQGDEGDHPDYVEILQKTFGEFEDALHTYAQHNTTPLDIFLCPSLEILEKAPATREALEALEVRLAAVVMPIEQIQVTVTRDYHNRYAVADARDALRFELAHIPYTDTYFDVMGTLLMRRLFNYHIKPYKVIVLDCDNTLWKGVCDEVGATAVDIDTHFQRFQRFLIEQKEKGVLLCLCSKNREQAVWDVFEQHPDMVLSRGDFVDAKINWQVKSENIQSLASELNLGLDSFIFIDDNPVECAEVRLQLPEVLTLQAPAESIDFNQLVDHLWVLDKQQATQEDKRRTTMYQQDKARQQAASSTADFGSFLESLNVSIDFHALNDDTLARSAQLTKRTNQFNLSTRRRSEGDIRQLMDNGYLAFTLTVTDRFGDYGTVGLVLADVREKTLFVDTFLLSCRVLGRGVEHKILAQIAVMAQERELDHVVFEYLRSAKNEPIANFLNAICTQMQTGQSLGDDNEPQSLEFGVAALVTLEFDPVAAKAADDQTNTKKARPSQQSAASVHQLQSLLEDTIFSLRSAEQIHRCVHPTAMPSNANENTNTAQSAAHAERVKAIFAEVLSLKAETLSLDAPIESIVDESYKIVDLTVALTAESPHLPQTLLFETRCLQDIVDRISGRPQITTSATETHPRAFSEEIAIIGMDGRFPGANNLQEFWQNLEAGICSMSDIPNERWDANEYYSADLNVSDKTYCTRGGFMNNAFQFDHQFFGISPKEAETMDPQQRLFLQTVWSTMENAGYTRTTLPRNTGVYVGVISSDYALNAYQAALSGWSHYRLSDYYQIPNRVSYYFDLHGPSLAIDSACSSSASALHLACHSLRRGECETAFVGGVNFIAHPSRLIQYAQMQMISKSGVCSPFSDAADGTLFGEGVCALMLKPLSKAMEDGDPIHGIIKSTAINSGGKTNGFTVPNPTAHARLISKALVDADIHPRSISYIEAHGTATNLGDPIEVRGLTEGFAAAERALPESTTAVTDNPQWCAIGSVKSNIGHLESCAALAGIVKCLLQMKHKTLVPSLTNGTWDSTQQPLAPNSKIDFAETPLKIQYTSAHWPSDNAAPRRAGISSFGAGGSNGHVIVEEPPTAAIEQHNCCLFDTQVAIFSAPSKDQLESLVTRTLHALENDTSPLLESLCYTLQVGREHFAHRLAIRCHSSVELVAELQQWLQGAANDATHYRAIDDSAPSHSEHPSAYPTSLNDYIERWLSGATPNWQQMYRNRVQKMALPGIEFKGRDFKIPAEFLTQKPQSALPTDNPFIGRSLDGPQIKNTLYETHFDLHNLPYLTDHRIYDSVVVPGSMYVAYVLSLVREQRPDTFYSLSNVTFIRAMLPGEEQPQRVQFSATPNDDGSQALSIVSRDPFSDQWHEHFSCRLHAASEHTHTPPAADTAAIISRMTNTIPVDQFYNDSIDIGFRWGPTFQCVKQLYRRDGEALGLVTLTDTLLPTQDHYAIHPAFLDACFQVFVPGMSSTGLQKEAGQAYLPLGVNEVHFYRPVPVTVWSHVITRDDLKKDSLTIDIYLYTEAGEIVAFFKEMQVLRASKDALMALTKSTSTGFGYGIEWQPLSTETTGADTAASVVLCGANALKFATESDTLTIFDGENALNRALAKQRPVNVIYTLNPCYANDSQQLLHNLLRDIDQIQGLVRHVDNTVYSPGISLYINSQANAQQTHLLDNAFVSLGRVIAIEYPQFWGGFIEVGTQGISVEKLQQIFNHDNEDHFRVNDLTEVPRLKAQSIDTSATMPVHEEGSYLITGAFGSLGQQLTEKLVGAGAKRLLLVSRREPNAEQQALIDRLTQQGADIVTAAIDLSHGETLNTFIDTHRDTLKGVIHLAGLLDDGALTNLTHDQFSRVLLPKVCGTWNLHHSTENIALDFFVLYSSASSLLGAAGQANYAMANGFLDAFAQYRQSLGHPAVSINWGPWAGAGMAAAQDARRKTWTNASFGSISPEQGADYLAAIGGNTDAGAQIAVLPYDWKALFSHYPVNKTPSLLRQLQHNARPADASPTDAPAVDADVTALTATGLATAERKRLVMHYLRGQVRQILGFTETDNIDASRSFLNIGFDSLMAVSFRTALVNNLNCYFPATLIFDYPNLHQLSDYIVEQLQPAEPELAAPAAPAANDRINEPALEAHSIDPVTEDDLSELSQEQVEQLLESELDDIERILEA